MRCLLPKACLLSQKFEHVRHLRQLAKSHFAMIYSNIRMFSGGFRADKNWVANSAIGAD